jgi:hypothetical protein
MYRNAKMHTWIAVCKRMLPSSFNMENSSPPTHFFADVMLGWKNMSHLFNNKFAAGKKNTRTLFKV